jgi:hypothetical protein
MAHGFHEMNTLASPACSKAARSALNIYDRYTLCWTTPSLTARMSIAMAFCKDTEGFFSDGDFSFTVQGNKHCSGGLPVATQDVVHSQGQARQLRHNGKSSDCHAGLFPMHQAMCSAFPLWTHNPFFEEATTRVPAAAAVHPNFNTRAVSVAIGPL